jgi:hypothetical protein
VAQNVPGAIYNTETGFEYNAGTPVPVPNPPPGFGFVPVANVGNPLNHPTTGQTGISGAGVANQGTRLALTLTNIPNGASVWVEPIQPIFRQGTIPAVQTGVMVLTSTNSNGAGAYTPQTGAALVQVQANNVIVYEVLYADVFSLEYTDVETLVSYIPNLTQNLPAPGVTTQGLGSFAPFYTTTAAGQPSSTLPIPRFTPGTGPLDLFLINKCACNLLYPYVVSTAGYDTGLAVANTSTDPGLTFGFLGVPQSGKVTFWYYGIMANGSAVPGPQTSSAVPSGRVLTYVLSSGSTDWGLDGRGAGLIGYMISQAEFQYCHAFAYIGPLGGGPTTAGVSEGYLALMMDQTGLVGGLFRTFQFGEALAH